MLYSNTLNHFIALDDTVVLSQNKFTQQGIKGISDIFMYDTFVGNFLYGSDFREGTKTADQLQEETKVTAGGR
jgi:hypothetical protein